MWLRAGAVALQSGDALPVVQVVRCGKGDGNGYVKGIIRNYYNYVYNIYQSILN